MRLALLTALAVSAIPRLCAACASCGCGDPTLTVLGTEKPLRDRLRLGLTALVQSEAAGAPRLSEIDLHEQRLELEAAWAPSARLFVLATLPLVRRDVEYVNLARRRAEGTSDLELDAKVFLWEDRNFAPHHLVSVLAGARLPTAPWARDAQGAALPSELQVGSGALSPVAGLGYAYFRFPWSGYASVEGSLPAIHHAELRPAAGARATLAAQRQLGTAFALRLSVDGRLDGHAVEGGVRDPDTGGTVAFVSPAVLVTPATDLVVFALARIPTVADLAGYQREGTILSAGVAYDW